MGRFPKRRMSETLRLDLEHIARMCNDYKPHEAGDALEAILGYPVGDLTDELERPDATDAEVEDVDADLLDAIKSSATRGRRR